MLPTGGTGVAAASNGIQVELRDIVTEVPRSELPSGDLHCPRAVLAAISLPAFLELIDGSTADWLNDPIPPISRRTPLLLDD